MTVGFINLARYRVRKASMECRIMFLYVPCASVRHWVDNPNNYHFSVSHLKWDAAKRVREYLPQGWPYHAYLVVPHGLRNFRFYSLKRLQLVPVHGYLTPVELFEEHTV
jgi:hypothetical protein